jgi:hypothetical protein
VGTADSKKRASHILLGSFLPGLVGTPTSIRALGDIVLQPKAENHVNQVSCDVVPVGPEFAAWLADRAATAAYPFDCTLECVNDR